MYSEIYYRYTALRCDALLPASYAAPPAEFFIR
jgi:hypothetical protein